MIEPASLGSILITNRFDKSVSHVLFLCSIASGATNDLHEIISHSI
jgi:hypothetical protein